MGEIPSSAATVRIDADDPSQPTGLSMQVAELDGDGIPDLAVAAPSDLYFSRERPGLLYVFPGPFGPGTLDPATDAAVVYEDDLFAANMGDRLAGCDLDGDGDDELVIGSPAASWADAPSAGRLQIVDGGPWRLPDD